MKKTTCITMMLLWSLIHVLSAGEFNADEHVSISGLLEVELGIMAADVSEQDNTSLSGEILSNAYDEDFTGIDKGITVITIQLAVEF